MQQRDPVRLNFARIMLQAHSCLLPGGEGFTIHAGAIPEVYYPFASAFWLRTNRGGQAV